MTSRDTESRHLVPTGAPHHTLATGSLGALSGGDSWTPIDLGPHHPARAGLLLIDVWCDAQGAITAARVRPGHSHRAAEKLFEVRDYRQVLMLADRHDWSASVHGELVVAAAAEELLGLPVPQRAALVRDLLAAHARIASHLGFLEFVPWRLAADGVWRDVQHQRARARHLLLSLTGNRVHPMVVRLGGVAADPDADWLAAAARWGADCASCGQALLDLLAADGAHEVLGHIGVLDAAVVDPLGLSGPISAASGVDRTVSRRVRRPDPAAGDARARFLALGLDLIDAAAELAHLAEELPSTTGPVETPLSKTVKVPEGEVFTDRDAPMGIAGVHLVSRSGTTPWRLRLRTPTFANVQALEVALVGTPLAQADAVIASLGHTIGDLDK